MNCSIPNCCLPVDSLGLCTAHYQAEYYQKNKDKWAKPKTESQKARQKLYWKERYERNKAQILATPLTTAQRERHKVAAKQHYDSNKEIYKQRARLQARKPKAFYRLLVKDAKERNLELTLSFEEFLRIRIGSACHYCGGDLPETGTGLDRKDSQLGYTPDNVVPCCWPCNNTKGHRLSYAEMLNLMAFRRENETAVRMISEC